MEGNVTERRLSVAVTPLWLDSSNTSIAPPAALTHENAMTREASPRPDATEDGLPPNKVQITTEVPRIQLPPPRHRGVTETFENTEVEELIAMLRETENLEDQGDILQYLVDTQGLDYNTGKYSAAEFYSSRIFLIQIDNWIEIKLRCVFFLSNKARFCIMNNWQCSSLTHSFVESFWLFFIYAEI